jgi:hypothetical protein
MTSGAIQCGVPINVLRFVIVLVSCGSAAFSCAMQCSFAAADCCDVRGVLRCRSGGLHGATQRKCAQRAGGAAGARSTYPCTCVAIQRTHVPHPPPPNTHTHTHTHKHTHTPTHTHTYLCCYTKVCQLDCTILCEQDVATLDVAVDTAKTVQVGQALINTQQRKAAGQQAGWIYTQIETRR